MEAVLVRAREPGDAEAVAEIFACRGVIAGTLQLPLRSVEATRERLAQQSADVHGLVAELNGRLAGTLGLHVETNPRRRHCAGLGMAVHDDFQGRGVGTALLAAALDLADNWLGLRRVELHVYVDNERAILLYERSGFTIEGTAPDYAFRDGTFADTLTMARVRR